MIFIDPPSWPAHGTVFSHLISDTSVPELHAFAAAAGVSERAFDVDHYDVPERIYADLVAAGAVPVSGRQLVRTLLASGLRVKARHRPKSTGSALQYRWDTLLPGQGDLGAELLQRWSEPHRHYHSSTHLLAMLEALDRLTDSDPPRTVLLAAWFHDAVYKGVAGRDEQESADLAQACLARLLPAAEVAETVRLILLTATHSPRAGDHDGAFLCDSDLAVLGGSPADYARYVAGVRSDYAHVPAADFTKGRAGVVRRLLALDPLFRTETGRGLWAEQAHTNLTAELTGLNRQDTQALP